MYKTLSEAMQERQRRNIATSTRNTAGVDETVWKQKPEPPPPPPEAEPLDDPEDERVRLVGLKLDVENKHRKVNEAIGWAEYNYRRTGRRADNYGDLMRERDAIRDRLNGLQQKLIAIKLRVKRKAEDLERQRQAERRADKQAAATPTLDGATLGEMFMQLAKEMLADPVYQRVMVAAIHRLRERAGK